MFAWFTAAKLGTKLLAIGGAVALLLAILGGTYYVGYHKGVGVSVVKIAQWEQKASQLQAAAAKVQGITDVRIVTEYKDRVAYVDRVKYQTQTVVRDRVPEQFVFSKGWVYAYNQSAKGLVPDATLAADATPSGVSDLRALRDTLVPNNAAFLANQAQLDKLQSWVRQTGDNVKAVNNAK